MSGSVDGASGGVSGAASADSSAGPPGSVWHGLLPVAMVGTERHSAALPEAPGDIGALVAQAVASAADVPSGVLRAAAVLATCSLAGAQGLAWTQPLPAAAPQETRASLLPGPLLTQIDWALHDGPLRLQHQLLRQLAAAQRRLPPQLLPVALELGRRSLVLRPLLLPVLGERGLWLAAQRDAWRFAAGVSGASELGAADARWQDGSFEQRREFLLRERQADPAAARERLSQALGELPAKERAELAGVLASRLGPADEDLLDSLRADRSRDVRQAALSLLLRLPEAAHATRAAERIARLLSRERLLLRQRWVIDAPASAAADWKADNVDEARPTHDALGERGWWLYQLVRQVPLGWWTRHTGMSAAALRDWADAGDWRNALLRGWRDVLLAAPDADWCEAFLDRWPEGVLHDDPATVLALLPPARRERYWRQQLQASGLPLEAWLPRLLAACAPGDALSRELSLLVAEQIRRQAEAGALSQAHGLRALLPELCCALHEDALALLRQLPRQPDETPSLAETLHTVALVISTREQMQTGLPALSPSAPLPSDPRTP